MELVYLIKILLKRKWLFLITIFIALFGAVFYYYYQPEKYTASMLFYVQRQTKESDRYYNYDGYYASQVGKEYTDTVVGFFKSLDVIKRAREITDYLPADLNELQGFVSKIEVKKEAPQLIRVQVETKDRVEAEEIVKALGQATIERIRLLNQTGDPYLSVDIVDTEPLVLENTISLTLLLSLSFVLGFIASLALIFLLELKSLLQK